MRSLILILAVILATPAIAQQQQQQTPSEQALGQKLLKEISEELQCSGALITANQKLQAAEQKIKELEDKGGHKQ